MREAPIIITGMLRSGTSYTAGWLKKLGLDLGDNLMPPGVGNVDGYFEDLDFVDFHEGVLKENGLSYKVQNEPNIFISNEKRSLAKEIILRKSKNHIWGWKVPMTCLVLDFWDGLVPEAKYIFIYRDFRSVANSLYKWELSLCKKNTWFMKMLFELKFRILKGHLYNLYISSWIIYNKKILDFVSRTNSNKYIVIKITDIYNHPEALVNIISDKFEISFDSIPINETNSNFDMSRINANKFNFKINKEKKFEAEKVLHQLDKLRIKL